MQELAFVKYDIPLHVDLIQKINDILFQERWEALALNFNLWPELAEARQGRLQPGTAQHR